MGNKSSKEEYDKLKVFPIDELIKEEAYKVEREILSKCSLKLDEQVYIHDVPIDYYGNNYIHTIRAGKESEGIKDHIVLLHGYQGSSITFYRLLEKLYPKFNVYLPDHLGMALSSRPNINFEGTEHCIEFFVEAIEKFREALNIDKFYLVGHSLGGYLAATYALKYPQRIQKLSLLSPAGITDLSKGGKVHENMELSKKVGFSILKPFWNKQWTMQGMFTGSKVIRYFVKKGLRKRYDVHSSEAELLAILTEITFKYPQDLDKATYYIFKPPIPSVHFPLEDRLIKEVNNFAIDFFFGQDDWMDTSGSKRVCEARPECFKYYTISRSGHNFNLENPFELGGILINMGNIIESTAETVQNKHNDLEKQEKEKEDEQIEKITAEVIENNISGCD